MSFILSAKPNSFKVSLVSGQPSVRYDVPSVTQLIYKRDPNALLWFHLFARSFINLPPALKQVHHTTTSTSSTQYHFQFISLDITPFMMYINLEIKFVLHLSKPHMIVLLLECFLMLPEQSHAQNFSHSSSNATLRFPNCANQDPRRNYEQFSNIKSYFLHADMDLLTMPQEVICH